MELQVGVKVLLRNSEDKYLVLKRSIEVVPGKGLTWDMPGGRIEPGSTLMDNLARELMEETGLTLSVVPRLIAAQDLMKVAERHVVRLTYIGEAEGDVHLSHEHTDYKWLSLEEIEALPDLGSNFRKLFEDGTIARATASQ